MFNIDQLIPFEKEHALHKDLYIHSTRISYDFTPRLSELQKKMLQIKIDMLTTDMLIKYGSFHVQKCFLYIPNIDSKYHLNKYHIVFWGDNLRVFDINKVNDINTRKLMIDFLYLYNNKALEGNNNYKMNLFLNTLGYLENKIEQ